MRWAVIFRDTKDMLQIRARRDLRDAHVAYAKAHPELLIGGGLKPNSDEDFCGALWVVEADSKADVVALIEKDPFYVAEHRSFEIFSWGKLLEGQTVTP
ncbi:YciI family protein [Ruegeria sp.]|uniref:YciI family protein n=1 Tax=Ruegeria sp. TaxID=1879320 RepID=UPI003B5BCB70